MEVNIEAIKSLIKQGRLCEAQSLVQKALKSTPDDLELIESYVLILNRSGASDKALQILKPLFNPAQSKESVFGLMGRIYKNLWSYSNNKANVLLSAETYNEGFKKFNSYYLGINAATMFAVNGDIEQSTSIAKKVIEMCSKETPNYWVTATLTEAYLLIGDLGESLAFGEKSMALPDISKGEINSTFQQFKMLSKYIDVPSELTALFSPPGIVTFSGHMIDHPNRPSSRFPSSIEGAIKDQIVLELDKINAQIGYSSAACGSDILFIEAMLEREAEVHIILPFAKKDFVLTSVAFAGEEWVTRFESVLSKASSVNYATEQDYFGEDGLFNYTNTLIQGQSLLRAKMFATKPYFLAVTSENSKGNDVGGTQHFVENFEGSKQTIIINPQEFIGDKLNDSKGDITSKWNEEFQHDIKSVGRSIPEGMAREVKSVLFADVVGFSKIPEYQKPYFLKDFMDLLSARIKGLDFEPEVLNSWGDAIFFVGKNTQQATQFAFMLKEMVLETNWAEKNLPSDLNIRIALHAGPVFIGKDPVLNRENAYGANVNRAARIEPVTIPGQIYASDQFTANLLVETKNLYQFEYVGNLELPKAFGNQDLYNIKKRVN